MQMGASDRALGTERGGFGCPKGNLGSSGAHASKSSATTGSILCGAFPISHWTFSCHRSVQFLDKDL